MTPVTTKQTANGWTATTTRNGTTYTVGPCATEARAREMLESLLQHTEKQKNGQP